MIRCSPIREEVRDATRQDRSKEGDEEEAGEEVDREAVDRQQEEGEGNEEEAREEVDREEVEEVVLEKDGEESHESQGNQAQPSRTQVGNELNWAEEDEHLVAMSMDDAPQTREDEAAAISGAAYGEASDTLSSLVRQLGFAAIAIVWLFSTKQRTGNVIVPNDLTRVAFSAVIALLLDFVQYVYKSIAWGVVRRLTEKGKLDLDRDGGYFSPRINWPALGFFWGKVTAIVATYLLLGIAVFDRLD